MAGVRKKVGRVLHDRRGATAIEYGLILALVVLAILTAVVAVANSTTDMWTDVSTKVIDSTAM